MAVIPLFLGILLHSSSTLASPLDSREYNAFLEPQVLGRAVDPANCRVWAQTYPWTTCPDFLSLYSLSMSSFFTMNPAVDFDCYGFKSGTEYCIKMYFPQPASTDGTCGQLNRNVTCVGSRFGDCCGASGSCGSTDAYCAIGNCQAGNCPGLGYSTDGNCGANHAYLMCGGQWGNCCSNAGKCGSTNSECGVGNCQYGACVGSKTSTSSTTSTSATPLPSPFSPSPDGTCGFVNQYKCTGTQYFFGYCCNSAGYCGATQYDCTIDYGCQSAYGLCDTTVTVTVSGAGASTSTRSSSSTSGLVSSTSSRSSLTTSSSSSQSKSTTSSSISSSSISSSTSLATSTSSTRTSVFSSSSIVSSSTSSSASSTPTLGIKNTVSGYSFVGCQTEGVGVRTLGGNMLANDSMTLEMCADFCQTYLFFGIEYGRECWCGNAVDLSSTVAPLSDCSFICPGNPYEYCGAGNRLELYSKSAPVTSSSSSISSAGTTSKSSSSPIFTSSSSIISTSSQSTTSSIFTSSSSQILTSKSSSSSVLTTSSSIISTSSKLSSSSIPTTSSSTVSSTVSTSRSSSSSIVTSSSSITSTSSKSTSSSVTTSSSSTVSSTVSTSKSSTSSIITSSSSTTSSAQPTQTAPIYVPISGNYSLLGCYREPIGVRALTYSTAADNMTVESCISIATGYMYVGI